MDGSRWRLAFLFKPPAVERFVLKEKESERKQKKKAHINGRAGGVLVTKAMAVNFAVSWLIWWMKDWTNKRGKQGRGAKAEPTGGAVRTAAAFTTSAHVEPAYIRVAEGVKNNRQEKRNKNKTAHSTKSYRIRIWNVIMLRVSGFFLSRASTHPRRPSDEIGWLQKPDKLLLIWCENNKCL